MTSRPVFLQVYNTDRWLRDLTYPVSTAVQQTRRRAWLNSRLDVPLWRLARCFEFIRHGVESVFCSLVRPNIIITTCTSEPETTYSNLHADTASG